MAAITTLATLKANVATALVRSDFTDHIAASVPLAEAWLNRNLRLRMMEVDVDLVATVGSAAVALPVGFLEPLAVYINDAQTRSPVHMRPDGRPVVLSPSRPSWYGIDGSNIVFDRRCDAAYSLTLKMLRRFALTAEDSTNALLESWPDLYLYAVLAAVCATYLTDDPRLAVWKAGRDELLVEVNRKEARSKAPTQLAADSSFTHPSHRTESYSCI